MEVRSTSDSKYRFLQAEVVDWIGGLKASNHYFLKNICKAPVVHKKRIRKFYAKLKVVRIQRKIHMRNIYRSSSKHMNSEDGI